MSLIDGIEKFAWRVVGRLRKSERMWRLVDSTGIVVFVGPNGSGKSLAAVQSALRCLEGIEWHCNQLSHRHNLAAQRHWQTCTDCERTITGVTKGLCDAALSLLAVSGTGTRLVYSTVPLLSPDGEPHPLYRPLIDYRQLITIEHSDVLFDEVAGISDSSDSAGIPTIVTNWLHQLRKRDVRLRVTTPAYSRCSKPIRQVAQVVVDSRAFFPERSEGRLWRPRKAMLYTAYDAFAFGDYTPTTGDRLKSMGGAAFWRPGSRASSAYDTLGAVLSLGHVTEGGMCAVCGGQRARPRCACSHEFDDLSMDELVVEEKVTAAGARTRSARVATSDDHPDHVHAA